MKVSTEWTAVGDSRRNEPKELEPQPKDRTVILRAYQVTVRASHISLASNRRLAEPVTSTNKNQKNCEVEMDLAERLKCDEI